MWAGYCRPPSGECISDSSRAAPSREKVNNPPPPRHSADRRRRCRAVQYLARRHWPAGQAPRSHRHHRRRFKGTRPGWIRLPLWRRDIMCCHLGILRGATQPRRQTRCCGGAQLDWFGSQSGQSLLDQKLDLRLSMTSHQHQRWNHRQLNQPPADRRAAAITRRRSRRL